MTLLVTIKNLILRSFLLPVYAQNMDDINAANDIVLIIDPIKRAFNVFLFLSGGVFIGVIFLAVFKFLTAQGDPKGIQGGKNTLTYAVMGLLVVIGVFAINMIVASILGIENDPFAPGTGIFDKLEEGLQFFAEWADV